MLTQERRERIIEIIEKDGSVKTTKLIKLFDVSIETVRRDLESLEKQGLLKRVYGGAVLKKANTLDKSHYSKRENEYKEEKIEIAAIAVRYIEEGESIALNDSTTNNEIAKELKKNFSNLTVITNSLIIANELVDVDGFTVILTGGVLNNKELAFYGDLAEDILSKFIVNKAFLGVAGISLNRGIMDYSIDEVKMQRKMMEISQEVIILADSSKIDNVSLVKMADIDEVNFIITDSKLDPKVLNKYHKDGIEIIMS
jgi:DeoR family transcriptional regulator, fructose operon transcriptional repressor